jgi:protein ImuB
MGEIAAKPRAPLAWGFGPELGRRLDQVMGCLQVRRVFAEPIGAAETTARATGKLTRRLCDALEAKGLGARRLDCLFVSGRRPSKPSALTRRGRCATVRA